MISLKLKFTVRSAVDENDNKNKTETLRLF